MARPIVDIELNNSMPKDLLLSKHLAFLVACEKQTDSTLDYLRLSGVFWTLTSLDLVGKLDKIPRDSVIKLILSCQNSDGGLSPAPTHDSHILSTLSGIQVLALYDCLSVLDTESVVNYILSLQQSDGSFFGDKWGEIDTRFSFAALASLCLLGKLKDCIATKQLNEEACASYLERCQNADGGFGTQPGSESHAGQAYCVVGAMSILHQLRRLNLDRARWWLSERQLPSGGLNGRPEKKPDVCYSWWALATLTMLGRPKWIDNSQLVHFILAAQDTDTGGIADRPGDMPDPYHTLFGLAGLSLIAQANSDLITPHNLGSSDAQSNGDESSGEFPMDKMHALLFVKNHVKPVNPVLCMPQYVIDRMRLNLQLMD